MRKQELQQLESQYWLHCTRSSYIEEKKEILVDETGKLKVIMILKLKYFVGISSWIINISVNCRIC